MPSPQKHDYDESKIKTLSSLEHIRLRTGMYIGRLGDGSHYDDGIYILLKEVVDNAIDEFIMGHGKRVDVEIEGEIVRVRDFGRGIPLGKVVECVSRINTGAKYNDDVFQFSVGLNGVGTKAVNALSDTFTITSFREGQFVRAQFERGILKKETKGKNRDEPDGTEVVFQPDRSIFKKFAFRDEHIIERVKLYTHLNSGLKIKCNGETYESAGGLLDLVEQEVGEDGLYPVVHHRERMIEIAFTHTNRLSEDHYSFVNGQYTSDGGTHLSAFREALLKAVNEFFKGKFEGDDVREGLVAAFAIRLKDPVFESQTKNKLGNTEIRSDLVAQVRAILLDLLSRNKEFAEKLQLKVEQTQRLRKELQQVRKLARERASATTLRIPQLLDCKIHLNRQKGTGGESALFIAEGQSAGGSFSRRDPMTQAVFTLKGKPLNVCDLQRAALYKNEEIYNLMRALNIEDGIDRLRYGKIVFATDADVDGLHIRNLLICFFLRFFPELVNEGRCYILETPLFRVRNKKQTLYCYSEAERDAAIDRLGKCECTRFKGLGEISPDEFKEFIGPRIKLTQVDVDNPHIVPNLLQFYMGKNTPARRTYIMDNLVVEEPVVALEA